MTTRYALISVSNKEGVEIFGQGLVDLGYTVLSTGGTAQALKAAGVPVTKVSDFTGAPEVMGGRVKTLHPQIHAGILGDRTAHAAEAKEHGFSWIDVVAVNLYPFEKTVEEDVSKAEAMEKVDIGGPTMVRAAAKNHAHVMVIVNPSDYPAALSALSGGDASVLMKLRSQFALAAFRHTSRYDCVISDWLARDLGDNTLPEESAFGLSRILECRYGENPHQRAAFYADVNRSGRSLARIKQHQGRELSFNNIGDLDGALRVVFEYDQPAVAIIKHMNPCGMATATDSSAAFLAALEGDPLSAYGGIVAFNKVVTSEDVQAIRRSRTFFEVLAAPGFEPEALESLKSRKKLRVIEVPGDWASTLPTGFDARRVLGGWLIQDWDQGANFEPSVVTETKPTSDQLKALLFAWKAAKHIKSNAIALAVCHEDGERLNGVGAGQMSRVDAVRIAVEKAPTEVKGSVLASDAFFPFSDGIEEAAAAGITAIIQPGGSIRDDEVIAAANTAGIAMVFTGIRHFRH